MIYFYRHKTGNSATNIGNVSIYANGGNASGDIVYAVVLRAAGSFTASDRRINISGESAAYDPRPQWTAQRVANHESVGALQVISCQYTLCTSPRLDPPELRIASPPEAVQMRLEGSTSSRRP